MFGLAAILSLVSQPRVTYKVEYDPTERTYYMRIRNVGHSTAAVYRSAPGYIITFMDENGRERKPPIRGSIDRSGPSEKQWALLEYLDEAAVRLDTDLFYPDPRVAYMHVTLNQSFLRNAAKFVQKDVPALTDVDAVTFPISLAGLGKS